jgi:hypothetical protein
MNVPTASLKLANGSVPQTLTTAFSKLTPFSTNGSNAGAGAYGSNLEGDASIVPTLASDGLTLFAPGIYLISAQFSGFASAADNLICQARLGGVAVAEATAEQALPATSGKVNFGFEAIITVTRPISGTSGVLVDLQAKNTTGSNLTLEYGCLMAQRLE